MHNDTYTDFKKFWQIERNLLIVSFFNSVKFFMSNNSIDSCELVFTEEYNNYNKDEFISLKYKDTNGIEIIDTFAWIAKKENLEYINTSFISDCFTTKNNFTNKIVINKKQRVNELMNLYVCDEHNKIYLNNELETNLKNKTNTINKIKI